METIEHALPENNSDKLDCLLAMAKEVLEIVNRIDDCVTRMEIEAAFFHLTWKHQITYSHSEFATIISLEPIDF